MGSSAEPAITPIPIVDWHPAAAREQAWQEGLERGQVLYCPQLAFALTDHEKCYLDPRFSDAHRKSIYIRSDRPGLFGAQANEQESADLLGLLRRFDSASMGLLADLFPQYAGQMRAMGTSYRPRPTGEGAAALSWRKDDTRLHVDAFPSNPTHGMRILRVFANVGSTPRVWRVGESFEAMARHFITRIPRPKPSLARLSHALGITKRVRSAYDHYMLYLHDLAKGDLEYQRTCDQVSFAFPPGSVWICFSDQVMHAAMSGQFMMEQTVHLPIEALGYPAQSPLAILERLTQRALL